MLWHASHTRLLDVARGEFRVRESLGLKVAEIASLEQKNSA